MKILRSKSFWLLAVLLGIAILGEKITIVISDSCQKEICTDEICINKPKGWVPILVDRGNDHFFLDLIDVSYIPFMDFDTEEGDSYHSILLGKQSKNILIYPERFILSKKMKKFYREFEYKSNIYYVARDGYFSPNSIYCPKKGIWVNMPSFDKDLLNEICNSEEKWGKREN